MYMIETPTKLLTALGFGLVESEGNESKMKHDPM